MVLKNPIFILGILLMVLGNSWFIWLRFRELLPQKPLSAFGILPALLIPPVTAMASFYLYKIHRGTKIPIWICGLGLFLCIFVQAANS